jgi:hypothetical protein
MAFHFGPAGPMGLKKKFEFLFFQKTESAVLIIGVFER